MITKDHNSIVNLQKWTRNNPNLDVIEVKAYAHQFLQKMLSVNKILTITKGHNCVVNLQKWTRNNPHLGPVNVIEYAKFGLILLIVLKILSGNEFSMITKDHNSVVICKKMENVTIPT